MTPAERTALLDWHRDRLFDLMDDVRSNRITSREFNRRLRAGKIVLKGIRDNDRLADIKTRLSATLSRAE